MLPPVPAFSDDLQLLAFSVRATVSNSTTLGESQPEELDAYDLAALLALPWQRYGESGWGVDTRLMTSASFVRAAGETGVVVSFVPELGIRKKDGRFVLDMGAGVALMSRYEFGTQDYGGPFQFALTAGAGFPVYENLGLGYRFMHYSDAGVNGSDTTGADLHMVEATYHY